MNLLIPRGICQTPNSAKNGNKEFRQQNKNKFAKITNNDYNLKGKISKHNQFIKINARTMSAFPGRRELSVGGPTAPLYHISQMYASHLMAFSTPRFRHRHERDQLLRITVCYSLWMTVKVLICILWQEEI